MRKDRVKILHTGADAITQKEALENIRLFLSSSEGHYVVTLNSEMVVNAEEDRDFRDIVEAADLVVADGMGIVAGANYLGKRKGKIFSDLVKLLSIPFLELFHPEKLADVLPEKISGIDLIFLICASDFIGGKKIYFLGAEEGVAKKAAEILKKKYPRIGVAGAEMGIEKAEMGIEKKDSLRENRHLVGRINAAAPDILFVALGSPRQEKWIYENLPKLESVRVAMGVGGSFDVIAGKIRRAPRIFQAHGMEWLWRLILEPRRIKRIYNATFRFAWLIFRDKESRMK
jgi:N-acetylglucosaminyldiphosphoundecaprenol N-acetyl-beta-D-mannosaminyltransferase